MTGTPGSNGNFVLLHLQQILGILFITALLIFLSSFVSLNHMIDFHESSSTKDAGKLHFLMQSRKTTKPTLPTVDSNSVPKISILTAQLVSIPPPTPVEVRKEPCLVHFPPKCRVHPSVNYWNEYTDCYISPLIHLNGKRAPLEERKFVVFQPDLGGWNNIRMALEVVILLAKVTGRILVFPPDAFLYLLVMNRQTKHNKSNMDDYFDFDRLRANYSLETMEMKEFLATIAARGLLKLPLPNNNVELLRKPLWDYLENASYCQLWSPGKQFLSFNISLEPFRRGHDAEYYISNDFSGVDRKRREDFSIGGKRELFPYNMTMHAHRSIFFPGYEENRLLTHFYSFLFFANPAEDRLAKRYMRDRLRYHDEIFCVASRIIETLLRLEGNKDPLNSLYPQFIAFHIRRGDFQQKHTRLEAERIVSLTNHLVPDRAQRVAYIATDEGNRSFFAPFAREYKAIYFLNDVKSNSGIENINQNYIGMIEQVICASAHTFIGTPLSTFTAYITRMRGYLNRTIPLVLRDENNVITGKTVMDRRGIYNRTYYFMKSHMYQLHEKPTVRFPLWVRDYVDVFKDIDEEAVE